MARIIGTSGAWKDVLVMARTAGIVVDEPSDVGIQLARAQKALYQQDTLARDDLALQQAALEHDLAEQRSASAADIARIQDHSRQESARLTGDADPWGLSCQPGVPSPVWSGPECARCLRHWRSAVLPGRVPGRLAGVPSRRAPACPADSGPSARAPAGYQRRTVRSRRYRPCVP